MQEKGFIFRQEKYYGPLEISQIKELISQGLISPQHHYWQPELKEWTKISDIETFNAYKSVQSFQITDLEFEEKIKPDLKYTHLRYPTQIDLESPKVRSKELPVENNTEDNKNLNETIRTPIFKKNHLIIFMVCFVALAISTSFYIYNNFYSLESRLLKPLNSMQIYQLKEQLNRLKEQSLPGIVTFSYITPNNDLGILIGTNLKNESKLKVLLKGVPNTLIGKYNVFSATEGVVQDGLISLSPLRDINGNPFVPGKYQVQAQCESCLESVTLTDEVSLLGKYSTFEYQEKLKNYHSELLLVVENEITELSQIISTLENQLYDLSVIFSNKLNKRINTNSANKKKWQTLQESILNAFSELDKPQFLDNLYFKEYYKNLRSIAINLNNLYGKLNHSGFKIEKANEIKTLEDKIVSFRETIKRESYQIKVSGEIPKGSTSYE